MRRFEPGRYATGWAHMVCLSLLLLARTPLAAQQVTVHTPMEQASASGAASPQRTVGPPTRQLSATVGTPDSRAPGLLPGRTVLLAAGAALAGSFVLDHPIREEWYLERPPSLAGVAGVGHMAEPQLLGPTVLLLYGIGRLEHRQTLTREATHMVAAVAASTVVTSVLKFAVGRERPFAGADADAFHPASFQARWQAFPSGHTAVAFAAASALAMEAHRRWVGTLAYGTAGAVGWSRIYHDRHWASDVVAGAVLGTLAGRAASRWLDRHDAAQRRLHVVLTPQGPGLAWHW